MKKEKIKENYKIEGFVKKAKLNIINQFKLKNFNLNFNINKNIYSLKQIDMNLNNIKISSPLIEVKKKKNLFFVEGQFLNKKKNFDIEELRPIFANLSDNIDIQKIEFSSKNEFSFNISKNLKFDNFKVMSIVDLNQLIVNQKNFKLKPYFPSFVKEVKLEKHKININYSKNKFFIKGSGDHLIRRKDR